MSSLDHRQKSATEQYSETSPLSLSGSGTQKSSIEQLSFPEYSPTPSISLTPLPLSPMDPDTASIPTTQALINPPEVTRALTEAQTTDAFSTTSLRLNAITQRQPVLIRGTGKKSVGHRPPESRRKPVMHIIATIVLALVVLSALLSVVPLGGSNQSSLLKSIFGGSIGQMGISSVKNNTTTLIAQQAATATVVTQDGYDPGSQVYMGIPTAPPSMGTGAPPNNSGIGLNSFFYGQCTYWANMRYQALTGHYVEWLGNANEWYAGALNAGWHVSSQPHVPSIIVLQAYVQGSGGYGHVAVVESIPSPGVVRTSDWNWYANGGWATLSYWNFNYPASGVAFVWR